MRLCFILLVALAIAPLRAQDGEEAPERPSKPPVALTFTPPGIEGDIVLGIFNAGGKLVRTLRYAKDSPELRIDTNGYIAQWDGLDEAGKPCAGGRYAAHGFAVGDDVAVDGEAFHFNDWMAEDKIPAGDVRLRKWGQAIGVELRTASGVVLRQVTADGSLAPAADTADVTGPGLAPPQFQPAPIGWAAGRDGSMWLIVDQDGQHVVVQLDKDGKSLRELRVPKDEPQPAEILAAPGDDAILLKESGGGGVSRVRMLRRGGSQSEQGGRVIADWEVVFERTMQPCANFGVVGGQLVADASTAAQADSVTIATVENPLEPGRKPRVKFTALATPDGGSMLAAPGGLGLVDVSSSGGWKRFAVAAAKDGALSLYQGDGIVVEEFEIRGLDDIAAFNVGSFLLAAPQQ